MLFFITLLTNCYHKGLRGRIFYSFHLLRAYSKFILYDPLL